ncbi:hypothetical protein EV667_1486 [Ancylobacter aquaticus]|uniref:Uncharacterized protein n=1 Tax=Ancylobacter aquaticus TaxID=100 RepID=A0A4R1I7K1_ANCAQ|nr:hypothetical protein EV667_1486 [Ancylobacter aquaticus]
MRGAAHRKGAAESVWLRRDFSPATDPVIPGRITSWRRDVG